MEQGAVAGEHCLEPLFSCCRDKLGQERVEQRLAHEMEIEKADLPSNLIREQVEFLGTQLSFASRMLGAKVAVEVASVRYFYVAAVYHFY